jgi:hypothetical protein
LQVQLAANVDFTFETGRKSVRRNSPLANVLFCPLSETLVAQVLEMLHSCAKEFADDVLQVKSNGTRCTYVNTNDAVLQAYSDTVLLALVTRLVNEPSRSVKAMVVQVKALTMEMTVIMKMLMIPLNSNNNNNVNLQLIKQLVVRASKQQVDGIVQMIQEWSREGQVLLAPLNISSTTCLF